MLTKKILYNYRLKLSFVKRRIREKSVWGCNILGRTLCQSRNIWYSGLKHTLFYKFNHKKNYLNIKIGLLGLLKDQDFDNV